MHDRRNQPPIFEPAAPAILHIEFSPEQIAAACEELARTPGRIEVIDVAHAARATDESPRTPAPKLDAMEFALLQAAVRSAAGDKRVPPRRDLIAVALREAE